MDYTADFETTTNEEDCRVWAWAACEISEEATVTMGTNMETFLAFCEGAGNCDMWFHNLAFDGEFIVNYLLNNGWEWVKEKPGTRQFSTLISNMGKYYQVQVCFKRTKRQLNMVTFKDSLKKLTMSVEEVARAFGLPISKLSIDYDAFRPVGHRLTDEEKQYLKNDVLIMSMALRQDFQRGLTRLTTGADALAWYQDGLGKKLWRRLFPEIPVAMDTEIRRAYKGGWTYANPRYSCSEDKPRRNIWMGSVYDKNSMYPSVMYSDALPVGLPAYFTGRYTKDPLYPLYIQYLTCSLKLKPDHLPTVQIKGNPYFDEHEYVVDSDGMVDLALTNIDLDLLSEHYEVVVVSWNGGYKFRAMRGMFCDYIDHWMHIKETTGGGERLRAKLMLNSLYGKFATNPDVTGKVPYLKEGGQTGYRLGEEETRAPVYTPMGAFITAYARRDIITNCQRIFSRFLYADTDSIHCLGQKPLDLDFVHPTKLGAWKHESDFDLARYVRSKTYAERVTHVGKMVNDEYTMVPVTPYIDVKACGCPKNLRSQINFGNFRTGLELWGKLRPNHVKGGIVLTPTTFSIK